MIDSWSHGADVRSDTKTAQESLASLIAADRVKILDAFVRELEAVGSVFASDPVGREQVRSRGDEILTDLVSSLNSGSVQVSRHERSRGICADLHPQDVLPLTALFQEVIHEATLSHLDMSEATRRSVVLIAATLNRSIGRLVEETTDSYQVFLLNLVRDAHIAERHRVARELHDRVGGALSSAHQMLELHEMLRDTDPPRAAARLAGARSATAEAIDNLRQFMANLRFAGQVNSIEAALLRFIDSAPTDGVDIRLRVSGDETWASAVARDETYLILREAARNALTHGRPSVIAITVSIAPHELRASVIDDGCGFEQSQIGRSRGGGLSSMHERAALLGGSLKVSARPAHGASVELIVPLAGRT